MTESIAGNIITETRDGDGRQWIFLSRAPVEEVLSITIDGLDIPPCAGAVDAGYFVVDQSPVVLPGFVCAATSSPAGSAT